MQFCLSWNYVHQSDLELTETHQPLPPGCWIKDKSHYAWPAMFEAIPGGYGEGGEQKYPAPEENMGVKTSTILVLTIP